MTALFTSAALADWTQPSPGNASFVAKTTAIMKVEGTSEKLEVKSDGKLLHFKLPVASLETGMGLRNRHMLEALEGEKFPELTLDVPLESIKVPADGAGGDGEAKGTLTLHGVTKELPFKYSAACKAGACDVQGTAEINIAEHGVKVPNYMGVTVKPAVAITAKFSLKR